MNALEAIKKAGMRKVGYGLAALGSIVGLAAAGKLDAGSFKECFIFLVGAVMASNYGEHREKAKSAGGADAPAPAA